MSLHNDVIRTNVAKSLKVIRMYEWLLDLYVLDSFVDKHWVKLPLSWQKSFDDLDPQILGQNIMSGKPAQSVLPLSFMAFVATARSLSLPREKIECPVPSKDHGNNCGTHPRLKNLFLKHVKLKKRHEISLMADVVKNTAIISKCGAVIDFGSGLGHLVRVLAYKNDLYTAEIECQPQLTEEARKLDSELEYTASKHLSTDAISDLRRPIHFNLTLTSHSQIQQLPLPDELRSYGLVGLHPCGDLGPLLLRHFVDNMNVKFICVVGCCFMKLTCHCDMTQDGDDKHKTEAGYPMSDYVKGLDSELSYPSREIACHAIEVYTERLVNGNYEDLKVHAYRAALEQILVDIDPKLKHAPVRSIKHSDSMTFERYCSLALERLQLPVEPSPAAIAAGAELAEQGWRRVVVTYSLRLLLAPLVETVILLDRVLYVLENGLSCQIRPVFDPKISARNHIITATRT